VIFPVQTGCTRYKRGRPGLIPNDGVLKAVLAPFPHRNSRRGTRIRCHGRALPVPTSGNRPVKRSWPAQERVWPDLPGKPDILRI